jgi:hypothetical protein
MAKKKPFKDWRERAKDRSARNPEQFVIAEINRRDWISYVNPVTGRSGKVERRLADTVLLATKGRQPEPNEIEVLAMLVGLAHTEPYRSAFAGVRGDYKQLEMVWLQPPQRATADYVPYSA